MIDDNQLGQVIPREKIVQDISTPTGFHRSEINEGSFGHYLRMLPLKEDRTVYLYNGQPKRNQNAQYVVIDRSPSNRDLMQCADAIIRLRSEYLYNQDNHQDIAFHFVSGDKYSFSNYLQGLTPAVEGNSVTWKRGTPKPVSPASLTRYLDWVYMYAGTASLIHELRSANIAHVQIGDVFIQQGQPYGHAVIVVDRCVNPDTQEIAIMLAQSYMPAQDLHILKNPRSLIQSPWYIMNTTEQLITPEWTFLMSDIKRF